MASNTNLGGSSTVTAAKRLKIEDDIKNSSTSSDKALLSCDKCGQSNFPSRNQVFKHLKYCIVPDNNPLQEAPLPESAFNAQCDAYLYVTGGRLRGKTLGTVERYSFRRGCWEACPSMLENRGSHGSCSVSSTLYVVGGGGFRSNLASNEKCDCRITPAVTNVSSGTSAAIPGSEVTLSTEPTSQDKQQPQSPCWMAVASMPTSRHALAVLAAPDCSESADCTNGGCGSSAGSGSGNGGGSSSTSSNGGGSSGTKMRFVYAIGGWVDGTLCSAHVERYDTRTDTWHACAPMAIGRRLLGACELRGKIYAFGGLCADGTWNSDALEIYDPVKDVWARGLSLPVAGQCSAAAVGAFIYIFIHGFYAVRYDTESGQYTRLCEELPLVQWFCFDVAVLNDSIYLVGGNVQGVWSNVVYEYVPFTNQWRAMPAMLRNRRRCSATAVLL